MVSTPAAISVPSDGSGGATPAPRNESADSSTTPLATSTVESTRIDDHRSGRSSRRITRNGGAPAARAASTN
jgi:hypothetical protein